VARLERTARAGLLARVAEPDARRLMHIVLDGSLDKLEVIAPPTVGVVMARAADGVRGDVFNFGEVVVTEARVSLGGYEGWAMIVGNQPDRALALAIVDAALEAGHSASSTVERAIRELAEAAERSAAEELRRVAATRVRFEVF
jgi:alpha-D-ribose 1-methylphosphonate 5-triphosphate synthase subunit PhnG